MPITITGTAYKHPLTTTTGKAIVVRFLADEDFTYLRKNYSKNFDEIFDDSDNETSGNYNQQQRLIDWNHRTDELQAEGIDGNILQKVNLTLEFDHLQECWNILACEHLGKAFFRPHVKIGPETIKRFPHHDIPFHIENICNRYENASKNTDFFQNLDLIDNLPAEWVTDTGSPEDLLNLDHACAELQKIAPENTKISVSDNQLFILEPTEEPHLIPNARAIQAIEYKSFEALHNPFPTAFEIFQDQNSWEENPKIEEKNLPATETSCNQLKDPSKPSNSNHLGNSLPTTAEPFHNQNICEAPQKTEEKALPPAETSRDQTKESIQTFFSPTWIEQHQETELGETISEMLKREQDHRFLLKAIIAAPVHMITQAANEIRQNAANMEKAYGKFETLSGLHDPLLVKNDPLLLIDQIHELAKQKPENNHNHTHELSYRSNS
jgi:hypothetical protein